MDRLRIIRASRGLFTDQPLAIWKDRPGIAWNCVVSEADRCRKQAAECEELAATTKSPLDKERWLKLAEEFIQLAESIEDRMRRQNSR